MIGQNWAASKARIRGHYTSDNKQLNEQWEWLLDSYQMLDIIKVLLNGLVSIQTGASVNLQAHHQIVLHVSINLQERSVIYKGIILIILLSTLYGENGGLRWAADSSFLSVDCFDWGWLRLKGDYRLKIWRREITRKTVGFCQHQTYNLFLSLCSGEIHKNISEFKPLAFTEINLCLLRFVWVNPKIIKKLNTLDK